MIATGKTNITAAKKLDTTPTGSPPPIIKYKIFLIAMIMTPATGDKIRAPISAGTSPKSTFKYGGNNGNGKFKKNKTNDIVPRKAIIININKSDVLMYNLTFNFY